ncbi:MAG TPA: hypothetical protein PKA05_05305 [Roseiflexaceae bacterium]|nr:hypothetical protein [Roseiflexaceae bacterium]HMP39778.1 hypothetical protein [Roseiflexaceae bacterium]
MQLRQFTPAILVASTALVLFFGFTTTRDYLGAPRPAAGPPGAYTTPLPPVSYVPQLRR